MTGPQLNAADSWNQFRGPAGTGEAVAERLPTDWDSDTNVVWRTELSGTGWSSPVVSNNIVYVTSAIGQDAKREPSKDAYDLYVLGFDLTSGNEVLRRRVIHQSSEEFRKIHAKNSHASPTPIVEGDRMYVHFGHQGTACIDLAGEVIWLNRELTFPPVHGNGGSPIIDDERLVFTCDGAKEPYVAALNKSTGEVAWKSPRPGDAKKKFSFCTPTLITVAGKPQIIAPGSDCVVALNPENGNVIWQVDYDGYSVVPKPVFADGIIYVCTGFDRGSLLAIDPTGTGNITDSHVIWELTRGVPKTPSLIVHNGLLFLVSDGGVAMCLDAKTGDKMWQERIGGKFSASPIIANDLIYITSESGVTTVFEADKTFTEVAVNDLQERTLASMAAVDGALIMRTENALYRLGKRAGQ